MGCAASSPSGKKKTSKQGSLNRTNSNSLSKATAVLSQSSSVGAGIIGGATSSVSPSKQFRSVAGVEAATTTSPTKKKTKRTAPNKLTLPPPPPTATYTVGDQLPHDGTTPPPGHHPLGLSYEEEQVTSLVVQIPEGCVPPGGVKRTPEKRSFRSIGGVTAPFASQLRSNGSSRSMIGSADGSGLSSPVSGGLGSDPTSPSLLSSTPRGIYFALDENMCEEALSKSHSESLASPKLASSSRGFHPCTEDGDLTRGI